MHAARRPEMPSSAPRSRTSRTSCCVPWTSLRAGGHPAPPDPRPVPSASQVSELGWQMEQAGDLEGLDALLREETSKGRNSWYETCENAGRTTAFLDDVRRAWRLTDAAVGRHNGGGA